MSQRRNAPSWFTLIDQTVEVRREKKELLLGDRWKDLSVPTTFVWGEKDAWVEPELGEVIASQNPWVRLVRIPDADHGPWFGAPYLVKVIEGALRGAPSA